MSKRSSFMFALPSVWEGIARTFDLAGNYDEYNGLWEGPESDAVALLKIGGPWATTSARRSPSPVTGLSEQPLPSAGAWRLVPLRRSGGPDRVHT